MGTATRIPVSRALRTSVTTRSRRVCSPRKAARLPVASELAQELGARQGQQVPGPAGSEGRHQLRGADLRDAEEPFEVAAGEQVLVELFELSDGVGDGEQPARLGGHGSTGRTLAGP